MKSIGKRHSLRSSLVTVLYVRNLSNSTTEDQLHGIFSMGGALRIERVKKLRDFAFIHYCKREDAEIARERFDGMILDGCMLEVTWAKPPEAQKQKQIEKSPGSCIYRQISFGNLDHSFELNSSPVPSFSLFPRPIARPRMQMSNISGISNTYPLTKPIQLLAYICNENSWDSPIFQVTRIDSDPSEIFYICWIIIPNLPSQARRFMSDKICRSPEEAKHYAACHVLKKLGVIDADLPFVTSPQSVPLPNVFPNMPKSYLNSSNSNVCSTKSAPNFGLCSPQKTASFQSLKMPITSSRPYFFERGQGDAGNFLSNAAMDAYNTDDIENCTPLLDPETPIEPNSILGLLSSLAVANNVDLPLFNKPKL